MKKNSKIKFSFDVHSFKHLYNNYSYSELIDYAIYLQNIYFNIHFKLPYIRSSDKSVLIRGIRDVEFSLIELTYKGEKE